MSGVAIGPFALIVLLVLMLNAALFDLREHRVPNILALSILVAGIALAGLSVSGISVAQAIAGSVAGLFLLLPFYVMGGFGAGDVKLLAAAGSFLGPLPILMAGAGSLLSGAVFAGFYLLVMRLKYGSKTTGQSPGSNPSMQAPVEEHPVGKTPFAFAPFIFLATACVALTGLGS